jgi:hypothetical protein
MILLQMTYFITNNRYITTNDTPRDRTQRDQSLPIDMLYTLIFYFYFYFFKENTCHLNESSLATRHVIATKSMY